jgi:hypothetical protein
VQSSRAGWPVTLLVGLAQPLALVERLRFQRAAPSVIRSASGGQDQIVDRERDQPGATPDSPCNRTGPFGVVITWLGKDWTG